MHNDEPGVVLEFRGHTLTVDEAHAMVFGSVGFLVGLVEEIAKPFRREPHYVVGTFMALYVLGRWVADCLHQHEHDDFNE